MIDSEAGKEAWTYICDIIENGGLVESFKEATTWDKVYESFANGEATFLLGGDWCAPGIDKINPDLEYGITTMVEGKTQATVLGGWTWNINANCKNPEAAYDLISYLNSEDGDSILAVEGKDLFLNVGTYRTVMCILPPAEAPEGFAKKTAESAKGWSEDHSVSAAAAARSSAVFFLNAIFPKNFFLIFIRSLRTGFAEGFISASMKR